MFILNREDSDCPLHGITMHLFRLPVSRVLVDCSRSKFPYKIRTKSGLAKETSFTRAFGIYADHTWLDILNIGAAIGRGRFRLLWTCSTLRFPWVFTSCIASDCYWARRRIRGVGPWEAEKLRKRFLRVMMIGEPGSHVNLYRKALYCTHYVSGTHADFLAKRESLSKIYSEWSIGCESNPEIFLREKQSADIRCHDKTFIEECCNGNYRVRRIEDIATWKPNTVNTA